MEQQGALPLQRTRFRVAGYAQAFPSTALKNPELALQLGVDPEWIRARCGVDSRYISGPGETTTTLGVRAARQGRFPIYLRSGGNHHDLGGARRPPSPHECPIVPAGLPGLRDIYTGLPPVPVRSGYSACPGVGADTRL